MLSRYTMYRGPRPSWDPLPKGIRQDTRKHTRHCLRPTAKIVAKYLAGPSEAAWMRVVWEYFAVIEKRFLQDRTPFDDLADLAMTNDVFLGCSCPTTRNSAWERCHTFLALRFMNKKYPQLAVVIPNRPGAPQQGASAKRKSMKSSR